MCSCAGRSPSPDIASTRNGQCLDLLAPVKLGHCVWPIVSEMGRETSHAPRFTLRRGTRPKVRQSSGQGRFFATGITSHFSRTKPRSHKGISCLPNILCAFVSSCEPIKETPFVLSPSSRRPAKLTTRWPRDALNRAHILNFTQTRPFVFRDLCPKASVFRSFLSATMAASVTFRRTG